MEMLHEKSTSLYFGVTKFQIFVDLDTKLLAGISCIRSVGFLSEIFKEGYGVPKFEYLQHLHVCVIKVQILKSKYGVFLK